MTTETEGATAPEKKKWEGPISGLTERETEWLKGVLASPNGAVGFAHAGAVFSLRVKLGLEPALDQE